VIVLTKGNAEDMVALENCTATDWEGKCAPVGKVVIPGADAEGRCSAQKMPRKVAYFFMNPPRLLDEQTRLDEQKRILGITEKAALKAIWRKAFKAALNESGEFDPSGLPLRVNEMEQIHVQTFKLDLSTAVKVAEQEKEQFAELTAKAGRRKKAEAE